MLGQPRHARVGGEGAGAHLVGADEPLVHHAEDQLVPAAPARRVAVAMRSLAHEEAGGAQARCDLGRHLGHALALERTVSRRRSRRPRRRARGRRGRRAGPARSPPRRSPGRCARCPCPRRPPPGPTRSPDARRPAARAGRRRAPRSAAHEGGAGRRSRTSVKPGRPGAPPRPRSSAGRPPHGLVGRAPGGRRGRRWRAASTAWWSTRGGSCSREPAIGEGHDHGPVRQLHVRLEHLVLRDRRAAARMHQGMTRWPRTIQPRSWHRRRKCQMWAMLSSDIV